MYHSLAVKDIGVVLFLTDSLDSLRQFLMHRGQQFLLFLLNILLGGLVEELDTLVHLLQFLLTDLFHSVSQSSLLSLIVLHFLLELLVHRSQLCFVLALDRIHFEFYLCHFRHLSKELLRVHMTEFLCAGEHRQNQHHCNNNFFHFYKL